MVIPVFANSTFDTLNKMFQQLLRILT